MGNLAADTALEGANGRYRLVLSRDWEAMGPHGGYLSAIALRAAGCETAHPRPVSFYCQYLNSPDFAAVDIEVATLRESRRTAALQVTMRQKGRLILMGQAWTCDRDLPGLAHEDAPMPDVLQPEELRRGRDWLAMDGEEESPAGSNMDWRPIGWRRRAEIAPGPPVIRGWTRFEPQSTFDDAFVDGGRLAYVLDTLCFAPATVTLGKPWEQNPFVGPSMDLVVHFHRDAADADWLFHEHHCPISEGGLVSGWGRVWSRDGRLLASGGSQCICLPNPAYEGE